MMNDSERLKYIKDMMRVGQDHLRRSTIGTNLSSLAKCEESCNDRLGNHRDAQLLGVQ